MIITIPEVLKSEQAAEIRKLLIQAPWIDGKKSAGLQAAQVKKNREVDKESPQAKTLSETILSALKQSKLFAMAALPAKLSQPQFNSYQGGETYGAHVDNAIKTAAGTSELMRGDLSATLFLSEPAEYDGGELTIEDTYGVQRVKLPAGHLILYPAGSLHQVMPVTRGERIACFFWIQSLIRDDGQRTILLDMDLAVQKIIKDHPQHPSILQLLAVYQNLLRSWMEV